MILAGPTGVASGRRRCVALRIALLAVVVAIVSACSSSGGASSAGTGSYGSLPTFLPSSAVVPDSIVTGVAGRTALTVEGEAVEVQLADRRLKAEVDGPVVPGEGLPYVSPATTCTWTVTLSAATKPITIALNDFTTIDHLGVVYHVAAVPGQPAIPAVLEVGATASFELRAVMPTGEGLMRWSPDGGPILATWDFEVEND